MSPVLAAVLTTIQPPTESVRRLSNVLTSAGGWLAVAGDLKGPASYDLPNTVFLSLQAQWDGPFALARKLPTGHYGRKNIAYLEAMRRGATCIYETDDDNAPLPEWRPRTEIVADVRRVISSGASAAPRWVNVYRYFTADPNIWPRGFPLDAIQDAPPEAETEGRGTGECAGRAPIQQGLVNGSPDVDAIWRLTRDGPVEFEKRPSLRLEPGNWCPFNTQSTWWWPAAYPLLYIPSHCSFRMCDIWKSFVAQRCLWALGLGVVFHAPEVVQARNPHDLMRDFCDELPGYQQNRKLARTLDDTPLQGGEGSVAGNLLCCYEALVRAGFFPADELALVTAWLEDGSVLTGSGRPDRESGA